MSLMTQPNLLELAKQGDSRAIAALMNRHLQPRGITVKVNVIRDCLMVIAESTQPPNQSFLVNFVSKGMIALEAEAINRVVVWGQASGKTDPAWREIFELSNDVPVEQIEPSTPVTTSVNAKDSPTNDKDSDTNDKDSDTNGKDSDIEISSTTKPPKKSRPLTKGLTFIHNGQLGIAFLVCFPLILMTAFYAGTEILGINPYFKDSKLTQVSKSTAPLEKKVSEPKDFLAVYFKSMMKKGSKTKGDEYWCSESKDVVRSLRPVNNWKLLRVKEYSYSSVDTLVIVTSGEKGKIQHTRRWNIYLKKESNIEAADKLPGGWCIASIYEK